jgi:hypothetical protein
MLPQMYDVIFWMLRSKAWAVRPGCLSLMSLLARMRESKSPRDSVVNAPCSLYKPQCKSVHVTLCRHAHPYAQAADVDQDDGCRSAVSSFLALCPRSLCNALQRHGSLNPNSSNTSGGDKQGGKRAEKPCTQTHSTVTVRSDCDFWWIGLRPLSEVEIAMAHASRSCHNNCSRYALAHKGNWRGRAWHQLFPNSCRRHITCTVMG